MIDLASRFLCLQIHLDTSDTFGGCSIAATYRCVCLQRIDPAWVDQVKEISHPWQGTAAGLYNLIDIGFCDVSLVQIMC